MLKNSFIKSSIPLIAVASLIGVVNAAPASQGQDAADAQLATIKQYCSGCHSDKGQI
jgi:hypothetical protein